MTRAAVLLAVLVAATPLASMAQSPFSDWPEPERRQAKPAAAKPAAPKPKPAVQPAAKSDPAPAGTASTEPAKASVAPAPAGPAQAKIMPEKAAPAPAKAAPAKTETDLKATLQSPMKVLIMRSSKPECEPDCPEWISAQGRIVANTASEFKTVMGKLGTRKLPVLVHSPGGDVKQAQEIARMIRAKGLDVVVARTTSTPCPPTDKACVRRRAQGQLAGVVSNEISVCTSACPIILAGGVRRFVGPRSAVGVHQMQSYLTRVRVTQTYRVQTRTSWGVPVEKKKTLISEKREQLKPVKTKTDEFAYTELEFVFSFLGVSPKIIELYKNAPHESMRFLNRLELLTTKLATHLIGAERVLAGDISVAAPRATPSAPVSQCSAGKPTIQCDPTTQRTPLAGSTVVLPLPSGSSTTEPAAAPPAAPAAQ